MTSEHDRMTRRRFDRQLDRLAQHSPWLRRLRQPRWTVLRVLTGLLLICGGFLAILPVFGLWMIPLGLALLAIDIPALQGPVTAVIIRGRRWFETLRRPPFR